MKQGQSSSSRLIRRLRSGPIDVIGDIHGEAGPLMRLLDRLGYDGRGRHPKHRTLVFVGDLVDRGPDSVAVVNLVRRMVESGHAQMVLGNHELNLILRKRKHGNHWFYGETESLCRGSKEISFQRLCEDEAFRTQTIAFLRKQPLALEREDVRIVHAAWDPKSIRDIRAYENERDGEVDVLHAYRHFEDILRKRIEDTSRDDDDDDNGNKRIDIELEKQNGHPIKVLTSGMEEKAAKRYFAGGRWRVVQRAKWWKQYNDKATVVIGHYWRTLPPPALFRSLTLTHRHGTCLISSQVVCIYPTRSSSATSHRPERIRSRTTESLVSRTPRAKKGVA